jgi:tRNA (adenine37-N6)-methyltransferase
MSSQPQPEKVVYTPIGTVASRFNEPGDPKSMRNSESTLVLDEKYTGALDGLDKYRYLLVIYHIDRSPGYRERVHPMGDQSIPERGVLATRSPCHPNPIGITVAEILSVQGNRIRVTGLDALNGTPILDIKPYEEHFDSPAGIKKEREPGYRPSEVVAAALQSRRLRLSVLGEQRFGAPGPRSPLRYSVIHQSW